MKLMFNSLLLQYEILEKLLTYIPLNEKTQKKTENAPIETTITHFVFLPNPKIYDECTFSADAMIANGTYTIPEEVVHRGVVVDEWWPLSGQEGPDKEGMIHLVRQCFPNFFLARVCWFFVYLEI